MGPITCFPLSTISIGLFILLASMLVYFSYMLYICTKNYENYDYRWFYICPCVFGIPFLVVPIIITVAISSGDASDAIRYGYYTDDGDDITCKFTWAPVAAVSLLYFMVIFIYCCLHCHCYRIFRSMK